MPNRLIIVESPSKARTLGKFLGSGYTIKASMGHVRDLPKSRLGVDIEHAFAPEYEVTKATQIKELRQATKRADEVLLASDPDREGEAIAWHLSAALKLRNPGRIVFHEITPAAVRSALAAPRDIDRDLVAAQEARRVIDRLVGYQLSPLLWKKVQPGTSAGRVQSAAVRLVVDREREIDAFVPEESWTLDAVLATAEGAELTARLHARRGEPREAPDGKAQDGPRLKLTDEAAAVEVIEALGVDGEGRPGPRTPAFSVVDVVSRQTSRSAPAPQTTSTLQQDASTRLRFSPKRTMSVAQQLYEGVELGDEGPVGLITYMRTDSTRVSEAAREVAVAHIARAYGSEYVGGPGSGRRRPKSPVAAQDAHEAIRPTDPARTPESVRSFLSPDQRRLYELIWRRFVASQMAPARFDTTRVDIEAGGFVFRATGSVLRFDGFTRVLRRDDDKDDHSLPSLTAGQALDLLRVQREQHFTQPPPRYTEATLVKELEEQGVGRPSTYAAIIETIQERRYVRQEERRLHPTPLGVTVDGVLREHFPSIVDIAFTADLEKRLDSIEGGERGFEPVVREWYGPFAERLARAEAEMGRVRVETGEACPECGEGRLVVRKGKYGEFVGCSRYPECQHIKRDAAAAPQGTGEPCPQCGRELVVRQSRRGPFVGCGGYPECDYVKREVAGDDDGAQEELGPCPECGRPLARRSGRRGPFVGCSGYPECRYIRPRGAGVGGDGGARPAPVPAGRDCPECGKPLLVRSGRRGPFVGCSGYPACRHTENELTSETAPAVDLAAIGAGPTAPASPDAGAPPAAPSWAPGASEEADDLGACPECGRPLGRRRGRFGAFVGCTGYPTCRFIQPRAGRSRSPAPTRKAAS